MWYHLVYLFKYVERGTLLDLSGKHGDLGVQVFFVISGFVLPYALSAGNYSVKNYNKFILKRIARLDPPYLATVVLVLFSMFVSGIANNEEFFNGVTWARVLGHFAYLNGFLEIKWLVPVFWTLAIEFQFYLLIGLIFPLFLHKDKRVIFCVLTILFLTSLLFPHEGHMGRRPFVFQHMHLFGMGIAAFLFGQKIINYKELLFIIFAASAGILVTMGKWQLLAGLFATVLIIYFPRWTGGQTLSYFGTISYSLYLIHWTIGKATFNVVSSYAWMPKIIGVMIAVIFSIAAADILHRFIEKPSQRMASGISYRKQR